MKKLGSILAALTVFASAAYGCGGAGSSGGGSTGAPLPVTTDGQALAEGLSDLSPAELSAAVPLAVAPMVALPGFDEGPSWRRLLDPRPRLSFGRAVAQTRAPAGALAWYVDEDNPLPACATRTDNDSCLYDEGPCAVILVFSPACALEFNHGKGQGKGQDKKPLLIEGRVSRSMGPSVPESSPGAGDGAWTRTTSVVDLMTTDTHTDRWLVFNGSVTQTFDGSSAAAPYDFIQSWTIPAETPTAVESSRGDKLAVFGATELRVLPGSSAESRSDVYQMMLGSGERARSVRRQVTTMMSMLTETTMAVEVHSRSTSLTNGEVWARDGKFTVEQLDKGTVLVSGSNVVVGPDGTIYDIRLTEVALEDGAPAPLSGTAIISIDGALSSTVTFNGDCQAVTTAADGTVSTVEVCSAGRTREKKVPR